MGFFTGLDAESYDRTYGDVNLTRRMWAYFRSQSPRLFLVSVMIVIVSLAGAATPILVSRGVDAMARQGAADGSLGLAAALFGLGVVIWGANWVRRIYSARAVGDVMLRLRQDAFAAAAGHDLAFFSEHASGRIVSRITSDTNEFAQVVVLVTDLINQFLEAIFLLVVLASIEIRLVPWLIGFLPLPFLIALSFRRLARRVTREGFRAMANVNALIKEAVTGIGVAKNFRQEAAIYNEFTVVNRMSYRINLRRGFVLASVFPTLNALGGVGTALLVYVGGLTVVQGLITVGAWYLFISSLDYFWFPVLNLSAFWSQVQGGLSAAERVFALIDAQSTVVQVDQQPVPRLRGEIAFDHLQFHYLPSEPVLEDLSLLIAAGEDLALVGHTGAGKSTIAKLISRFYEFQGGALRVDGRDVRTFDLQAYRRQLGIVPQVPFLFSGTVYDNIRYARPEAKDPEIESLARRIGEGEWLEALPNGLASEVGERGGQLSMGQRQLVSLMRVLVQRPAIFILDEATANIDPFTEFQIQEALRLILEESTSILIAHRLSTVRAADRIIVLRQGKIIEEGDHNALMARRGHYAELYQTYFRHQSLEYVESARRLA
ncbi:MAG TPA: ABC transporter ATP-binding protein [Anaerolineales bacterium]|nr:ABC transporter ATP-binding protein [Anaerolineales bacterium]